MKQLSCVRALVFVHALAFGGAAQSADSPASGPAEASPALPEGWEAVRASGLIDLYYSYNFNHPVSGNNQLRNFDVKANQFSLNMAKLKLERAPEPAGFRVDLGFGRAFEMIHASEAGPGVFQYVEQAFVLYRPKAGRGFQLDLGKFVTSAGAEVIETHANWNYSRSLLFAYAIPYYHFGLRASLPLGRAFSAGVQLVNGWNNVEDNNSGKTAGFTAAVKTAKLTWTNTCYIGAEEPNGDRGLRRLYDTTLVVTPATRTAFYLNFDHGLERAGGDASRWTGVAGAARLAVTGRAAVSSRLEWFRDAGGFATGATQKLKEVTLTGEYRLHENLLGRLEYRRDWSDVPYFDRGPGAALSRSQSTLLAGFVAVFGSP